MCISRRILVTTKRSEKHFCNGRQLIIIGDFHSNLRGKNWVMTLNFYMHSKYYSKFNNFYVENCCNKFLWFFFCFKFFSNSLQFKLWRDENFFFYIFNRRTLLLYNGIQCLFFIQSFFNTSFSSLPSSHISKSYCRLLANNFRFNSSS